MAVSSQYEVFRFLYFEAEKYMSSGKYIKIELESSANGLLLARLSPSKNIRKYFRSTLFYIKYDRDVSAVSKGILYIPFVSNVITFAWAIGADIYVKELDGAFLASLENIRKVMKSWYAVFPFSTQVHVGNVTSDNFVYDGYGLLFSGGLDSMSSYIVHRSKKPNLIMVGGADVPHDRKEFWGKIKTYYQNFADQEGVRVNFVKTNMHFLRETMLNFKFGKYLTGSSWWGALQHGVGLLGLCAPLTVTERLGTIYIASSYDRELLNHCWGSHPLIDNNVTWMNVKIIHDGFELSRHEKIRYILKNHINETGYYPPLRVCHSQFDNFNCGTCEKCSRTITGLVLENIEPNNCGFNIEDGYFDSLKRKLVEKKLTLSEVSAFFWKDMQKYIPQEIDHDLHNCKEFFYWFKNLKVSKLVKRKKNNDAEEYLAYLFHQLPENIQSAFLKIKNNYSSRFSTSRETE